MMKYISTSEVFEPIPLISSAPTSRPAFDRARLYAAGRVDGSAEVPATAGAISRASWPVRPRSATWRRY